MKLSQILSLFILLVACSSNLLGEKTENEEDSKEFFKALFSKKEDGYTEEFYQKYNQPKDAEGSQAAYIRFLESSEGNCSSCNLRGFYLGEIIKKHAGKNIDLSYADCRGANLSNVDLTGADLHYGKFDFANFQNSTLDNANAAEASFKHANMSFVKMQYAKIQNAKFRHACLLAANLYGTKVNLRTSFRYANCRGADFRNLDGGFHPNGAPGKANFKEADLKNCKIDPSSLDSSLLLKIAYRINRFYDSHPKPVL